MRALVISMKTVAAALLVIFVVVVAWLLGMAQAARGFRTIDNRQSKIENGSPDLHGAYRFDRDGIYPII
jgi:hypothetical protein